MPSDSPSWIFDLVDTNGQPLLTGGITSWESITITETEGGVPQSCVLALPLDTDAAQVLAALTDDDSDIQAYVKGYRLPPGGVLEEDRELKVYSPVLITQVQGSAGILLATCADPLEILTQRFTAAQFPATDLGELLFDMIDETNTTDGETGILVDHSNIAASSTIDVDLRTNLPSIAGMIDQFYKMLDGVEVWSVPMELASGKIAVVHASPSRGSDLSAEVVFGYGVGSAANCSDMGRTTPVVTNDQRGYTDTLTSQKTNAASIAALRRRVAYTSFTGETEQAVMDARTQGLVDRTGTKRAVSTYTAAPGDDAPRLWDDYNIGDTVMLDFRDGVEWQVQQCVAAASVVIDADGNESPGGVAFRGAV